MAWNFGTIIDHKTIGSWLILDFSGVVVDPRSDGAINTPGRLNGNRFVLACTLLR